ncbi:MAG: M56 family metallopeptidase [Pseudomonadota bacterium]
MLLSAAAFAAERASRMRRMGTRWIWGTAILASLLLPTVISSISIELPNIFTPSETSAPIVLRDVARVRLAAPVWVAQQAAPLVAALPANPDSLIKSAWLAVSITMLLALAASAVVLDFRKRRWPIMQLAGADVYVTPDAGPAVVGLLRSRIVLPLWLTKAPAAKLALVMAHEKEHLAARDPQLLTLALCLLVLMPWNLPLWWQLRRLRHAIEVDCDARVLRAGHDLRHYGEALVDVGQHQSGYVGAVAAMAESRSFLEQRIRIMVALPGRWSKAGAALMAGMALCMVAAAAQLRPPNGAMQGTPGHMFNDAAMRHEIALKPSRLIDYEGVFQLEEFQIITFTRVGRHLWSQVNGLEKMEQYPERVDQFFSRDINAQITFHRDGKGRVDSLVLHRLGTQRTAPRVDGAEALALTEKINAFRARGGPAPGGEAILRRNAEVVRTGVLSPDDLTPGFAREAHIRMPALLKMSSEPPPGKLVSVEFLGINRDSGEDLYRVAYENRIFDVSLLMNSDGKIAQAWMWNAPK